MVLFDLPALAVEYSATNDVGEARMLAVDRDFVTKVRAQHKSGEIVDGGKRGGRRVWRLPEALPLAPQG